MWHARDRDRRAAPHRRSSNDGITGFLADSDDGLVGAIADVGALDRRRLPRARSRPVLDRGDVRRLRRRVRREIARHERWWLRYDGRDVIALDVDGTLFDGHTVDPAACRRAYAAPSPHGHMVLIVTGRAVARPAPDHPRLLPDVAARRVRARRGLVDWSKARTGACRRTRRTVATASSSGHRHRLAAGGRRATPTIGLPAGRDRGRRGGLPAAPRLLTSRTTRRRSRSCPTGFDKGTGLPAAIDHLGLAGGRVLAIGDAINDLPMFARRRHRRDRRQRRCRRCSVDHRHRAPDAEPCGRRASPRSLDPHRRIRRSW